MNGNRRDPLNWIDDELAELESQHLLRRLRVREGHLAAEIELDGQMLIAMPGMPARSASKT